MVGNTRKKRRKNSTKGSASFMLGFTLSLILAVMLWVSTASIVSDMFRISSQSTKDYQNLKSSIEELTDNSDKTTETKMVTIPLTLDDKTAILFYGKEDEMIEQIPLGYVQNSLLDMWDINDDNPSEGFSSIIVPRPVNCPKDKACICISKRFYPQELAEGDVKKIMNLIGECSEGNFECKRKIIFMEVFDMEDGISDFSCSALESHVEIADPVITPFRHPSKDERFNLAFAGGMMMYRMKDNFPVDARFRKIKIEKLEMEDKTYIKPCFESPEGQAGCFFEEERKMYVKGETEMISKEFNEFLDKRKSRENSRMFSTGSNLQIR